MIRGPSFEDDMKCQQCLHLKHTGKKCPDCEHDDSLSVAQVKP